MATTGQVGELEEPISIAHFNVSVPTPTGMERAPYIVKKRAPSLTLRMIIGLDEIKLTCAEYHKLGAPDGSWVFAKDLRIGDGVVHRNGVCTLKEILPIGVIDLYDIQVDAPHHSYYDASGILHHNTIMVAGMCDVFGQEGFRTMTIVPSSDLVTQTSNTFKLCGIEHGVYSGAEKCIEMPHVIATWQALQNKPQLISDFHVAIVDEAHGAKAQVIGDLLTNHGKHIGYRYGFTGTWPKPETDQYTLRGSIGEILYRIDAADLIRMGYLANLEIQPIEIQEKAEEDFPDYASEKSYTSRSQERLEFLADLIIAKANTHGNTLVLVNSIKQGQQLQKLIKDSVFLCGADENDVRAEWYSMFDKRDDLIVLATAGIASTGISIDRIFHLCLIDAGKSFVRAIQSIGRGLRKGHDKEFVHVSDVYSGLKWGKKHARERIKFYKEASYTVMKTVKAKL